MIIRGKKVVLFAFLLVLCGCKTQFVPVETLRTEYKTNTVHDSVFVETVKHDSVFIHQKGDTVFVTKWHTLYKDRWRDRLITDTVIKVDSVQVPCPVERKLTKWEEVKMDVGGIALGIVVLIVVLVLLRWLVRVKMRR